MLRQAESGAQEILGERSKQTLEKFNTMASVLMGFSEAWRYNGPFTRINRFKRAFPGLGIATVAFTGYVIFEALFLKDSHGHGEGHGETHH